MPKKTLADVLDEREDGGIHWRAAVPMATNPLLMLEAVQLGLVGGAVALLSLCAGVWFTEGSLIVEDIVTCCIFAGWVALAVPLIFAAVCLVFFGNRYFAVYRLDAAGIYHETSRGSDQGGRRGGRLAVRPLPVCGTISAQRTRGRHVPWDKADRFEEVPSMRVLVLRRGPWTIVRLFLPDERTYADVSRALAERLPRV